MARLICGWTDKLPESCRDAADGILLTAARGGARQEDLAALAAEIYARSLPEDEDDPEPSFEDRKLRVETTFAGAGVIAGDLTPECAAVVTAVLEALSAPAGAQDTRTREQRYHDALADAMRRLVAAGLLPERAGQPVHVWAHVSLAELRALDDGSVLAQEWVGEMAVRWAARRAAASQAGSDGAAWLDGKPARAVACDATVIPVVTSGIDPAALDDLVALCLTYAGHGPHCGPRPGWPTAPVSPKTRSPTQTRSPATRSPRTHLTATPAGPACGRPPRRRRRCSAMASSARPSTWFGPRRPGLLPADPAAGRPAGRAHSLPLDVGHSAQIPAAIRRAVILRDQHCRWAGGCDQPASACEVHHVTHLADGGTTSVDGCALYCFFNPPRRDPPVGLDRRPAPRRHHHRPQPRRHQNPAQPRTPHRTRRVNPGPLTAPRCLALDHYLRAAV